MSVADVRDSDASVVATWARICPMGLAVMVRSGWWRCVAIYAPVLQ